MTYQHLLNAANTVSRGELTGLNSCIDKEESLQINEVFNLIHQKKNQANPNQTEERTNRYKTKIYEFEIEKNIVIKSSFWKKIKKRDEEKTPITIISRNITTMPTDNKGY